jgi:hypothetical protein
MLHRIFIILSAIIMYGGASCTRNEEPEYFDYGKDIPIVDGKPEKIWDQVKSKVLYYYYGQEAEDSLDFKSSYKVLQHKDDIYILVTVYDQIKYTHPKPTNIYDMKLWNPADYDRVNLSFDTDNDGKDDFSVSMNYGLDTVFTNNISPKEIEAVLSETLNGYNTEFRIPLKNFKKSIIKFNIVVTDNDKKFAKEGLDVFERFESMYGRGCIYRRRNFK